MTHDTFLFYLKFLSGCYYLDTDKTSYLSCLYYLCKFGPMSQMRLCEVCDENKSAICRKIEYLTQHDYVQKDTSADTKYKKSISLTIKGKKIAQYISSKVNEIIEKANADFSDTERALLYSGLEKVNQKLKKITTSE